MVATVPNFKLLKGVLIMKNLTFAVLLALSSSSAFADYLMDKYDLDSDKTVTVTELEQAGLSLIHI